MWATLFVRGRSHRSRRIVGVQRWSRESLRQNTMDGWFGRLRCDQLWISASTKCGGSCIMFWRWNRRRRWHVKTFHGSLERSKSGASWHQYEILPSTSWTRVISKRWLIRLYAGSHALSLIAFTKILRNIPAAFCAKWNIGGCVEGRLCMGCLHVSQV